MLITPDELRTKLGRDIDEEQAQQACDIASAQVQTITKQTLVQSDHVEAVELVPRMFRGQLLPTARLHQRPVQTVNGVTVDGAELQPTLWQWDPVAGLLAVHVDTDRATVDYTAGWHPLPADLKGAALHLAAAEVSNPTGIVSERLGDYQVTWSETAADKRVRDILAGYRAGAGTVRVR